MKSKVRGAAILAGIVLAGMPAPAKADDWYGKTGEYYTVYEEGGQVLFTRAGVIYVDDEYISGGDRLYRVSRVDEQRHIAYAQYVEDVVLQADDTVEAAASSGGKDNGTIAIYCTHTDESYVPTEGTESVAEGGGILDVAQKIAQGLEAHNYTVVMDDSNHVPHDAGAYRRSRRTAVKLMRENQPLAMLDIHRDGVPDADEYIHTLEGEKHSRIRLVVGRSNQNVEANKEFAVKLKKAADAEYPGLVKDIFIGKGTYNQDLMPRALIVEVGTHTVDQELAMRSADKVADIVAYALGGAVPQSQAQQDKHPQNTAGDKVTPQQQSAVGDAGQNKAAFKGIGWLLGGVLAVGVVFLFVAMNSGGRVGRFFHEITGTGKRKK